MGGLATVKHEEHFRKLERMYASAPINRYFAPKIKISEGSAEVTIPVRPDLFHAAGAVHGAVYFKALDDAAFFAANSVIEKVFVLTVSFNSYLLRPISEGEMTATGRLVHHHPRLMVAESVVADSNGRQIARGSGTFVPSRIRLTPEIGYE